LLKIAVLGAAGRMGRTVLSMVLESDDLRLVGAVTEPNDKLLGRDAGEETVARPPGPCR
jgi:4-hydroxy-tetrahydrodipicolinate reductase